MGPGGRWAQWHKLQKQLFPHVVHLYGYVSVIVVDSDFASPPESGNTRECGYTLATRQWGGGKEQDCLGLYLRNFFILKMTPRKKGPTPECTTSFDAINRITIFQNIKTQPTQELRERGARPGE